MIVRRDGKADELCYVYCMFYLLVVARGIAVVAIRMGKAGRYDNTQCLAKLKRDKG